MAEFRQRDCDVLGVNTDAITTHERWLATPRGPVSLTSLRRSDVQP